MIGQILKTGENKMSTELGYGFGKILYTLIYPPKQRRRVVEFLYALSVNKSHRWIQFPMIVHNNNLWITERQANWLISMVKGKMKLDLMLEPVVIDYQSNSNK